MRIRGTRERRNCGLNPQAERACGPEQGGKSSLCLAGNEHISLPEFAEFVFKEKQKCTRQDFFRCSSSPSS